MERHEKLAYFPRVLITKKTTKSLDNIIKTAKEATANIVKKTAGRVIISILSISAIACKDGKLYAAKTQ